MDDQLQPRVDHYRLARRVIRKRWRLILLVFLVTSTPLTVRSLMFAPKTYETVATIFFEDAKKRRSNPLREWLGGSSESFQLALLRSRSLAEEVIDNLSRKTRGAIGGGRIKPDSLLQAQNFIRWLRGKELVFRSPQASILAALQSRVQFARLASGEVEIRAVTYQPQVAMELANAYVKVLQTRSRSFAQREARAAREFIESFLSRTKEDLQQSEAALAKFQRDKGAPIFRERSGVEIAKLAQLENTLADIQATKEIAKLRLNYLRGGKDLTGKAVTSAARVTGRPLRDRLAQLEEKLATLLEKYTEHHPLVTSTQAEIEEVQANLKATVRATQGARASADTKLKPAERAALMKQMTDLEVEIASLEAREDIVKRRIATLSQNLATLSRQELEGMNLLRKAQSKRNLYNVLSDRLSKARIQEQAEGRNVRVIDYASLPMAPRKAPLNQRILLGLLLGLGLGAGLATLLEYFNHPIETEDDVIETTGLPVLGWLPIIKNGRAKRLGERRPLSFAQNPNRWSIPLEGCRAIRTAVESLSRERPVRSLMLASAGPKEGKSTVLLNLGWVFWELGRRLIIVDTDLRRPTLHRALRSSTVSGVADLLTANASWDKVRKPIKEDFHLIPRGPTTVTNPGALLRADKVRTLLDLLTERADLVLFDSAPVLAVSDNLILASMVDGVILVTRAGHTQHRELSRAKEKLERAGAQLLGVVINQVSLSEARHQYARYNEYYGPEEVLLLQKHAWWDPRSWWRPKDEKRGGLTR